MYARGKRDGDEFHPLTIRFPNQTWAELVELKALNGGKSVNLMVQEAVEAYITKERERYELPTQH